MQNFIFENVRNHLAQPRWLGSTHCPAQRASGGLPPNAPFRLLTRTRFKSSSQSPERTISTQSPDETIPPKAPMKNYTQKRLKTTAKKMCFLVSGKGLDASQVSAEGPAARTCLKTPKDWMAAWSNLEYYFYYIGTNASQKGLRSRGFPSFHPVLLLASTRLPGIYGSNAETDSGPCSVPVWDIQSSRSIVAMLFFNQRCAKLWHPSRCSCLLFAVAFAFLGLACFNFPLSRLSKWKWNW